MDDTLKNTAKELSRKEMQQIFGGNQYKIVWYLDRNGERKYKLVRIN